MLIKGETFNQRKAWLLDTIALSRGVIRTIDECAIKRFPDSDHSLAHEVIAMERAIIKETMQELVELKRWQKARVNAKS